MKRLNPRQISDEFNTQRAWFADAHDKSGAVKAIEDLSRAILDIKDAGHDVSLTFFGMPSEQAFDLFPGGGALTVPFSGVLRTGGIEQLIALATRQGGVPVLKLAVSEFDIRFQGFEGVLAENKISGTIRHQVYDLKNDPEALLKFQNEIIRNCARNDVINAADVAGAFDNGADGANLRKPPRIMPKAS